MGTYYRMQKLEIQKNLKNAIMDQPKLINLLFTQEKKFLCYK
jgi:hypothetical protein